MPALPKECVQIDAWQARPAGRLRPAWWHSHGSQGMNPCGTVSVPVRRVRLERHWETAALPQTAKTPSRSFKEAIFLGARMCWTLLKYWLRPKVLKMRVIFGLIIRFINFLFQVCFFIRCSDNEAFFLKESYGPSLSGPAEPGVPICNYSPIHKRILCSTALLYTYAILLCIRKSKGLSIPL